MKYDPNNPLTDEELEQLGKDDFDSMLEYSLFSNLRANIVSFLEIGVSLFSF